MFGRAYLRRRGRPRPPFADPRPRRQQAFERPGAGETARLRSAKRPLHSAGGSPRPKRSIGAGIEWANRIVFTRAVRDMLKRSPHLLREDLLVQIDGHPPRPTLKRHPRDGHRRRSTQPAISAASILAKTARDRYVLETMHARYPQYGFDRHKGYATPQHLRALSRGAQPLSPLELSLSGSGSAGEEVRGRPTLTTSRRLLGRLGEELAVEYLTGQGLRIAGRNVRLRGGELDIVAWDRSVLVFVEVRSRRGDRMGLRLRVWTSTSGAAWQGSPMRTSTFTDCTTSIAVSTSSGSLVRRQGNPPRIHHIRNAFPFRVRRSRPRLTI